LVSWCPAEIEAAGPCMNNGETPLTEFKTVSRRLAKRFVDVGENRLQLLLLEVEEERERIIHALLLALGIMAFALLAGVAFTVVVLLVFWDRAPVLAMSVLALSYATIAMLLGLRLAQLRRDWQAFSASLAQIRKDCSCLAEILR
jgi:uncharacterized membrane protein YqjE